MSDVPNAPYEYQEFFRKHRERERLKAEGYF
jgi:hypothetical protein